MKLKPAAGYLSIKVEVRRKQLAELPLGKVYIF